MMRPLVLWMAGLNEMLYLQVNMKASEAPWSIGEIGRRFDIATHVLRHWEDVGLLRPVRDSSGYRRYGEAEAVRVAVILRSQAAGLSLEKIRRIIDGGPRERHDELETHLAEMDERIQELTIARAMAQHAFECEQHDVMRCAGFQSYVADILAGRPPRALDSPSVPSQ